MRFSRMTVLTRVGSQGAKATWLCRCDFGTEKVVPGTSLRRGAVQSCGCLVRTHQLSRTGTYKSLQMMLDRCLNTRGYNYPRYGAKGIGVCERWQHSFEAFI